jgi:YVTN family beta-propeller protein
VTITGSGYSTIPGGTSVTFGTVAATSVTCATTTQCTAVSPAGTAGSTVDIRLTVSGQTSAITAGDNFTYTPTISNVQTTAINSTGATITWTTDVPCDSQVLYGLTTSYGSSTPVDPTLVTSHSVVLTGLTPGTLYHFEVKSSTAGGITTISDDFTFTTAPPSPRVYVANQQSNTVSVIEIASNTVVATVPVGTRSLRTVASCTSPIRPAIPCRSYLP